MTTREALEHGLANIRAHGWRQGRFRDDKGRVCAHGALLDPSLSMSDEFKALGALAYDIGVGVVYWNDAPGRTQGEVEALYEAVIAREPA